MPRLTDRLAELERIRRNSTPRPLPVVLPDTVTDAELAALRRRGVDAYRQSDRAFVDSFV